jgi:hypothetical protein
LRANGTVAAATLAHLPDRQAVAHRDALHHIRGVQNILALEIPLRCHVPIFQHGLHMAGRSVQRLPDFALRPDEELALFTLGISVLRAVESAVR